MWIAVTKRFDSFHSRIRLNADQIADGDTKTSGITSVLNREYWSALGDETSNRVMVGSWGKKTAVQPPYDVDMLFVLPPSVYFRFEQYAGNKQSALLQEVKDCIKQRYLQTDMRGDGQVVQVRFNSLMIEVLPAFLIDSGSYRICDTNNGGFWKDIDPDKEIRNIKAAHRDSNYNARKFIRMIKIWRDNCGVPLESYVIEALVSEFLSSYAFSRCSFFYYDWFCRDFFAFLEARENTYLTILDGSLHWLGNDWGSRAKSASQRSKRACEYEYHDQVIMAGEEWQKIFGEWIDTAP